MDMSQNNGVKLDYHYLDETKMEDKKNHEKYSDLQIEIMRNISNKQNK